MIAWQLSKTLFIFGKDSFCWSMLFLVSGLSFWKSVRMFRGSSVESGTGRDQTCRNRSIFAWLKPLNQPVNIRPYTYFLLHWRRESNLTVEENKYTAVSSLLLPHRLLNVSSGVNVFSSICSWHAVIPQQLTNLHSSTFLPLLLFLLFFHSLTLSNATVTNGRLSSLVLKGTRGLAFIARDNSPLS